MAQTGAGFLRLDCGRALGLDTFIGGPGAASALSTERLRLPSVEETWGLVLAEILLRV